MESKKITALLRNKLFLFITLLTLIGGFLRLYNIEGTLVFQGDQGRDASIVRRLITDGDIILVGPTTSVGKIQLGPLYYYFMAPWLLLSNFNPVGPAIGVAILGIITIPVFFYVSRKMLGTPAAIFSTTLYTFGNVIIHHTRSSWNPNPMPIVILFFLWGFWEAYQNKKFKFLIMSWIAYAVALQLHYMVLLLGPFFVLMHLLVLLKGSKLKKKDNLPTIIKKTISNKSFFKYFGIGVAIFAIFQLPLIIFDLRHDFLNYQGFLEFFQKGHHTSKSIFTSTKNMEGRMFQSIGTLLGFLPNYVLRNNLSWVILIAYAIYALIKRTDKSTQIIALFLSTSIIGLGLYEGDVFEHYIGFLFPIPFMMLGAIFAYLYQFKNIILKTIPVILTLALIYMNLTRYTYASNLGWQISDIKNTADIIAEDIGSQTPYNISLLDGSKDYRAMSYRYFAELTDTQLLPQDDYADAQVLYLISDEQEPDLVSIDVWEIQSFSGKTITDRWQLDKNLWMYKIEP